MKFLWYAIKKSMLTLSVFFMVGGKCQKDKELVCEENKIPRFIEDMDIIARHHERIYDLTRNAKVFPVYVVAGKYKDPAKGTKLWVRAISCEGSYEKIGDFPMPDDAKRIESIDWEPTYGFRIFYAGGYQVLVYNQMRNAWSMSEGNCEADCEP